MGANRNMADRTKELDGRVAVVTGAGRNIGRAIALELSAAGASVVVNARANKAEAEALAEEIGAKGGRAAVVLGDVGDPETGTRIAKGAAETFGRIDILVNNAAIRRETPIDEMTYADWREVTGTILDGAFLCTKACLPLLIGSDGGTIINMGGMSGHTGARDRAHVIAAKSGLVGFTRALAHDLAGYGITVNCVVPGLFDTARGPMGPLPQHHASHQTLVGRKGRPAELASFIRFLCGPDARYITGQTLHANGGAYLG